MKWSAFCSLSNNSKVENYTKKDFYFVGHQRKTQCLSTHMLISIMKLLVGQQLFLSPITTTIHQFTKIYFFPLLKTPFLIVVQRESSIPLLNRTIWHVGQRYATLALPNRLLAPLRQRWRRPHFKKCNTCRKRKRKSVSITT